jgi:hypothetical protein
MKCEFEREGCTEVATERSRSEQIVKEKEL